MSSLHESYWAKFINMLHECKKSVVSIYKESTVRRLHVRGGRNFKIKNFIWFTNVGGAQFTTNCADITAATAALRRHRRDLSVCARRVRDLSRTVNVFAKMWEKIQITKSPSSKCDPEPRTWRRSSNGNKTSSNFLCLWHWVQHTVASVAVIPQWG